MHSESGLVFAPNTKPQGIARKRLPAIFREAAELAASDGCMVAVAIWDALGGPWHIQPAELLWRSFSGGELTTRGDEAVLGLLLLAEILESAE